MTPTRVEVPERQRSVMSRIAPLLDEGTYLAGGVAVASTLRHRLSLDIDLFVPHAFDSEQFVERLAGKLKDYQVTGRAVGTVHLEVEGVPISVLSYRYPLLAPAEPRGGLPLAVASPDDLVCMKLSAIAGRGAAKDFWDLTGLLEAGAARGSLAYAMTLYQTKFASVDVGHVIRSLAYFGDADRAPLPAGMTAEHWAAIKANVSEAVKAL